MIVRQAKCRNVPHKPWLGRIALIVIDNEAFAQVHTGLFRTIRVMPGAQGITELVEKFLPYPGGLRVVLRRGGHVEFPVQRD